MKFDKNKLRMLSPDADDWNELVSHTWRNMECLLEGVLLYPKMGMSRQRLETHIEEFVGDNLPSSCHGSFIINGSIIKRGEDWAIPYRLEGWYNHFNLNEEYD